MMDEQNPGAVASTDQLGLVERLRSHYGHHFTTTRTGIVAGEHHDFTRHPLVGEAIAEIERLTARLTQASAAFEREQDRADAAESRAETAQAAERGYWQNAGAMMLVARSGQVTSMELARRLMDLAADKRA